MARGYGSGRARRVVLEGVDLQVCVGRARRGGRPLGLRQEHPAAHAGGAGAGGGGPRSSCSGQRLDDARPGRGRRPAALDGRRRRPGERTDAVPQRHRERRAGPGGARRARGRRPAGGGALARGRRADAPRRAARRAPLGRRAPARRHRARPRGPARRCWSPTSPRRAWTRTPARWSPTCCSPRRASERAAVLVATHEELVAARADRLVAIAPDGRLVEYAYGERPAGVLRTVARGCTVSAARVSTDPSPTVVELVATARTPAMARRIGASYEGSERCPAAHERTAAPRSEVDCCRQRAAGAAQQYRAAEAASLRRITQLRAAKTGAASARCRQGRSAQRMRQQAGASLRGWTSPHAPSSLRGRASLTFS